VVKNPAHHVCRVGRPALRVRMRETVPTPGMTVMGVLRFRGHPTKGGCDGDHGARQESAARPAACRDELGAGAVRLVLDEGKLVTQVARDLDGPGDWRHKSSRLATLSRMIALGDVSPSARALRLFRTRRWGGSE